MAYHRRGSFVMGGPVAFLLALKEVTSRRVCSLLLCGRNSDSARCGNRDALSLCPCVITPKGIVPTASGQMSAALKSLKDAAPVPGICNPPRRRFRGTVFPLSRRYRCHSVRVPSSSLRAYKSPEGSPAVRDCCVAGDLGEPLDFFHQFGVRESRRRRDCCRLRRLSPVAGPSAVLYRWLRHVCFPWLRGDRIAAGGLREIRVGLRRGEH